MQVLFAGFETMAADIAWIACAVHYGRVGSRDPKPRLVRDNAELVADLDPYFRDVYSWYSAFYSQTQQPLDFEEAEQINTFLDRGRTFFPDDFWLPFDAGMNYVGSVAYEDERQRLRGYGRAIDYLQTASKLEGGPDYVPMTVAWLHERRLQLRSQLDTDDTETDGLFRRRHARFLSEMYYLVDNPGMRRSIRRELRESKPGRRALKRLGRRYARTLRRRHLERLPYLPVPLWSLTADPDR